MKFWLVRQPGNVAGQGSCCIAGGSCDEHCNFHLMAYWSVSGDEMAVQCAGHSRASFLKQSPPLSSEAAQTHFALRQFTDHPLQRPPEVCEGEQTPSALVLSCLLGLVGAGSQNAEKDSPCRLPSWQHLLEALHC